MKERWCQVREWCARVFCAAFGHSNLLDHCFGYHHCARCGALLGDSLGGAYRNKDAAYVYHLVNGCPDGVCDDNYTKLGWRDRFLTGHALAEERQRARKEAAQ